MMSTKISDLFLHLELIHSYYNIHVTSLTISAFPLPPPPSDADIISVGPLILQVANIVRWHQQSLVRILTRRGDGSLARRPSVGQTLQHILILAAGANWAAFLHSAADMKKTGMCRISGTSDENPYLFQEENCTLY